MIQDASVYQSISDATNNSTATALQASIEQAIAGNLLNAANAGRKTLSIDIKQYVPQGTNQSDIEFLSDNIRSILIGNNFEIIDSGDKTNIVASW